MLLTVDAGNTNIAFAIMDGDEIKSRYRLITKTTRTSDEFGFFIMHFLQSSEVTPEQIEDVIISSVVPKLMYALTSAIIKYVHKKPIVISPDLKTGITVVSENRNSVGADRIVNTAWAHHTLHRSAIIVDFGTATTFDYVSAEGEFKFVVIDPGLGISAEALASLTAKLPEIEIRKPASVLGTNTVQGMQAGVVYGYIGAVEYIIRQMKKELGDPECMVVATGGLGKVVSSETDEIDAYVVTRTRYVNGSAEVETIEIDPSETSLLITDFNESTEESYSVQSERLGFRSPASNVINVYHGGIDAIDNDQPLGVAVFPDCIRFICGATTHTGARIYDTSGRLRYYLPVVENNMEINLPFGVYFLMRDTLRHPLRIVFR